MATIRKGDLVQVISGPSQERGGDRGKQGRVIGVIAEKDRVIVEGINFVTKHVKVGQTQRGSKTGGIETHEAPIHVSNVALVDPATKLPARVGFTVETDDRGKTVRVRYFKKSRRVETKKSRASRAAEAAAAAEKPAKAAAKAKQAAETTDVESAPEKDAE
jgi:large subunit ribosomal protein L24